MPTDCSELSKHALNQAFHFVSKFNAELTLLMVTQVVPVMGFDNNQYLPEYIYQQLMEESDQYDKSKLEEFWKMSKQEDIKANLVIIKGDPFTHIIKYAKETEMDLIVMGTHGRTGIQHVLLGSVAEKVIRYSPIPVMTVKDPQHSYIPI